MKMRRNASRKVGPERAVAHRDDALGRGAIEAVVEQHLEIDRGAAQVLVLRRERVAGEQEDLARRVEEAVAARLAGRLLHLLQAERATVAAEEASRELRREDHHVALEIAGGRPHRNHPRPSWTIAGRCRGHVRACRAEP